MINRRNDIPFIGSDPEPSKSWHEWYASIRDKLTRKILEGNVVEVSAIVEEAWQRGYERCESEM